MRKFVWNVAHYERYGEDMFKGVRPFDWLMLVVEIFVLVLIAGEVIAAILRWRQKRYATAHIMVFLDDGQKLQDVVPGRAASDDEVNAWVGEVKKWIFAVQSFLKRAAKQAVAVFNHHTIGPRYNLRVSPQAENWFYELDARLKALRSIMEKPDVYF